MSSKPGKVGGEEGVDMPGQDGRVRKGTAEDRVGLRAMKRALRWVGKA